MGKCYILPPCTGISRLSARIGIHNRITIMHPDRGPDRGKRYRAPVMEDEYGSSPMITVHTKPGRVLDHTPAAMLRRMGDGSARALKKVVSSCDMRRVGARSL